MLCNLLMEPFAHIFIITFAKCLGKSLLYEIPPIFTV